VGPARGYVTKASSLVGNSHGKRELEKRWSGVDSERWKKGNRGRVLASKKKGTREILRRRRGTPGRQTPP